MKKIVAKLVLLSLLAVLIAPIPFAVRSAMAIPGAITAVDGGRASPQPVSGDSTDVATSAAPSASAADSPAVVSTPPAAAGGATGAPATPAPAGNTSAVSDTFNVNQFLTTKDQKTYVPAGDAATSIDPTQSSGVIIILLKAIDLFVKIIGSIALIVFILGAILTITSEGKEDRLEKGKTAMVYALIGLVITFFSFIIVAFVQSILF
jgi:hypothetical protein